MAQVQKKTTTMSLTISACTKESSSSSVLQQRHSSLVQPLSFKPQRIQSPSYSPQNSGNSGVAPTFVKCLHDVSTVKGQLVVLECRIRGTPPLQVLWYREQEQILDSADFRILRKKASSTSVPEEVCTLVITEAFPEDSGMFKCIARNQYGIVSCSSLLEVYSGLQEVLAEDDEQQLGPQSPADDPFSSFVCDPKGIPPPEWPDDVEDEEEEGTVILQPASPSDTSAPRQDWPRAEPKGTGGLPEVSFLQSPCEDLQVSSFSEKPRPTLLLPPSATPLSGKCDSSADMSVANLPTFSPTAYPPSMFNYERPRHFIQSQPHFQAPSYESLQARPSLSTSSSSSSSNGHKSSPASTLSSPVSTSSLVISPRDQPPPRPASPTYVPKRSTVSLVPKAVPSAQQVQSSAAFLSSILPSQQPSAPRAKPVPSVPPSKSAVAPPPPQMAPRSSSPSPCSLTPRSPSPSSPRSPIQQPLMPSSLHVSVLPPQPQDNRRSTAVDIIPRASLKKTPQPVHCATDEEIQGTKDALIQDLENKLRCKEARRKNRSQMTYEERMARRLLGPDNAASVFDIHNAEESAPEKGTSREGHQADTAQIRSRPGSRSEDDEAAPIQEKYYAPRFLQVPEDLVMEEGRFCRIDFKVAGLPTPDVTWYLNGKMIRPDDFHKMLVCEKGVHSFIIEIVTTHHAGVYECVAKNRAGESRFTLQMEVLAQEMRCPPMFVKKMQNATVTEGNSVRLECQVSASPPPQIYWKKDKEMLVVDPRRMSLYEDGLGRLCLLIERVEKADAGWYTVSAINDCGMSTCNARLDVGSRITKPAATAKQLRVRPTFSQFSSLGGPGGDMRGLRSPDASSPRAPLHESDEL
ncbi:myotilin isoform X2 [Polypterus senegalus]